MGALHTEFEWDDAKSDANEKKHGVSFHDAAFVLADEEGERFHLDLLDERVATEDRWNTFALDPEDRSLMYVICWTQRGERTRIISARFADALEKRFYEEHHQT